MKKRKKDQSAHLESIETPLGSVKISSKITNESLVEWTKDQLDDDDKNSS